MKKVIAIVLAFILVSSLALPTFVFAADSVVEDFGNHVTPDEFWDENTNEDGSPKWENLSGNLLNATFIIKFFESIATAFRDAINTIFGFLANLMPEFDDDAADDTVVEDDVVEDEVVEDEVVEDDVVEDDVVVEEESSVAA